MTIWPIRLLSGPSLNEKTMNNRHVTKELTSDDIAID